MSNVVAARDATQSVFEPCSSDRWRFTRTDVLVGLVCTAALLCFAGAREIDGLRERRLAGSAADIARNHHWILPTLKGEPRFVKPLLADWMAAASMKLFGWSEFGFRLPFAMCGLGVAGLGYVLGRQLLGAAGGRIAALVLATTPYFVGECQSASTDVPLLLFAGAALVSWWLWHLDARPGSRFWWSFYASLALGCLAKGPLVFPYVAIPIVGELWATRRCDLLRRMRLGWGLLIVVAPIVLWIAGVCLVIDDAIGQWLADMNRTLNNKDRAHFSNFFSHLAHWPMFSFPWSLPGVAALVVPVFRRWLPAWPRIRFIYFALVGPLVLLCLLAKQPMHFLLPLALPLAVIEAALIARTIELLRERQGGWLEASAAWLVCFGFVSFAGLAAGWVHRQADASLAAAALVGVALAAPAGVAAFWARSSPDRSLAALAASGLLSVTVFSAWLNPAISRDQSCSAFARQLERHVPAGEPVHFVNIQEELPFYADRTFRKIAGVERDEPDELLARLRAGFVMINRRRYEELAESLALQFRAEIVATDAEVDAKRRRRNELLLLRLDASVSAAEARDVSTR